MYFFYYCLFGFSSLLKNAFIFPFSVTKEVHFPGRYWKKKQTFLTFLVPSSLVLIVLGYVQTPTSQILCRSVESFPPHCLRLVSSCIPLHVSSTFSILIYLARSLPLSLLFLQLYRTRHLSCFLYIQQCPNSPQ